MVKESTLGRTEKVDSNAKQLVILLSDEDFSKLQSLSNCTTIPLPILCRALLRQAVSRYSPTDSLDDLLFQLSGIPPVTSLSNREMDILSLMVQGISNREIASALKLSEQTVKNHVSSILNKMKANNRTQAALLALKHNLIQVRTSAELDASTAESFRVKDRVLILEGTSTLSKDLACCLTGVGLTVARIPNCPETLMTMNSFKPDIVVVDETVANSFEVCRQIHDVLGIPVLLAGEDPSIDIWAKALVEAGAEFYLRKPFDGEVLLAQLRAILARYRKTSGGSIQSQNQERHCVE